MLGTSRLTKDILSLIKSVAEGSETHWRKPSTNGLNFPALLGPLSRNHRRSLRARDSDYNLFVSHRPTLVPSLSSRAVSGIAFVPRGVHHVEKVYHRQYTATIISLCVQPNIAATLPSRHHFRLAKYTPSKAPSAAPLPKGLKGTVVAKNQIETGLPSSARRPHAHVHATHTHTSISSTRRGHVFSAGAPNSRRAPSPQPPVVTPRVTPASRDLGRSFQDTVGYPQRIRPFIRTLLYSLHNIVPDSPPPSHRADSSRGRNTRCHAPWYCIYPYLRPRIVNRDHRQ